MKTSSLIAFFLSSAIFSYGITEHYWEELTENECGYVFSFKRDSYFVNNDCYSSKYKEHVETGKIRITDNVIEFSERRIFATETFTELEGNVSFEYERDENTLRFDNRIFKLGIY